MVDGQIAQRQEDDGTFPFQFCCCSRGQLRSDESISQSIARAAENGQREQEQLCREEGEGQVEETIPRLQERQNPYRHPQ